MRADRLLAIMLLLQTRGKMTAQRLADRLEVSRRTILRDIDALCVAGVPIYAEGGHGGGIALDEDYRTTLAGLQDREVGTLFVGDNAQLLGEVGLGAAAESTLLKLLAVLPASQRLSVEQLRQRLLIDPAWWWRDSQALPLWEQLQQAVYEDRCIQTVYERADGTLVERTLEPYSLVAKSSVWYLVARQGQQLRTYRVARLRQVVLLESHFQRQAGFDLPAYWREQLEGFGELVAGYAFTLRVRADRLSFAQRIVPGRYQQLGPASHDGWLSLRFQLESLELAVMLVFGFGRDAAVVEPPELRAAALQAAQEVINMISSEGEVLHGDRD